MSFTDIFIKRPVFASAISLLILVVGIASYLLLPIRQYPRIDASVITVSVNYTGANADLMEGFVTTPIENSISSVDGIDYITSSSTQSTTSIQVHLKLGYDIDKALPSVMDQVSAVRWELPKEIDDPVISKNDPNATPIMWLAVTQTGMTDEAATDYLIRAVQPQLQSQDGVSQANIIGGKSYSMRIWLDPAKMAAHHVTAHNVQSTLINNNVQAAAGTLKGELQQFDVYSNTDLKTEQQFNDLVVFNDNNDHIVRIKDIGKAELKTGDEDYSVVLNGKKGIFIAIYPKSNANPLAVADEITNFLPQIREHLPKGLNVDVFWDSSKFIKASLKEVRNTIFEACFFVFIVIFLMIGSVRAVIVPIVTIPLSIIGVCSLMLFLNYSINTLTLLAFVLAIGLVVDDSIVVLENIHRHLSEGLSPVKAALKGAKEISFAVIAMTLTLAAVYAPIGFLTGLTGKLFSEFAFTLSGSVIFSGFIALTLSPMMCSKLYKENQRLDVGLAGWSNRIFEILMKGYKYLLHLTIKWRYVVVLIALVIYVFCYALYAMTPQELAPDEDQGALMSISIEPASANLDYSEQHSKILANVIKTVPQIDSHAIVNGYPSGVNSSFAILLLKPWDKRKATASDIVQILFPRMWAIPGIKAYPTSPPSLPGVTGFTPVEFVLKTTSDYTDLEKIAKKLLNEAKNTGMLVNTDIDLKIDKPQAVVDVDRDRAINMGIPMSEIASALNIFLSKPIVTRFEMNGRSYTVLPRLYDKFRRIPDMLNNLYLGTHSSQLIPMSNVVNVKERIIPRSLNHFQQLRSATITANLMPGVTLGDALTKMNEIAKNMLPKDIQVDYSDQSRQFYQAMGTMGQTFLFALIFIYLILAAQFESFRDPFIVMLSVPLSITGALLLLLLTGGTLNIYTEIGLVTLIGLITKNGILIVEFANQEQEKGTPFLDAIVTGASYRLRPILMTTAAMILGALPLILASGAGAISRRQLGVIIVGGMSFGTLLTLFVVPTAYYLLATKKKIEPSLERSKV